MSLRLPIVGLITLVSCRDHGGAHEGVRRSPLETGIARDLTAHFGVPVAVTCGSACEATLQDGTRLPIEITGRGAEIEWRVKGLAVDTTPIAAYIDGALADLHVADRASCGARIQLVQPGDRLACKLSGGGLAFVRIDRGSASLELALDAKTAAARGEPVTPARDAQLQKLSRALEMQGGESDGEEPVSDAGAR